MRGNQFMGAAALILIGVAPEAFGQADPRVDENGRDVRVWPPHRTFNFLHMRLDLDIADMSQPNFTGRQQLSLTPIGGEQHSLTLDAGKGLTINRVLVDGREAVFERGESEFTIAFSSPIELGQVILITTEYTATKPGGGGAGLTWSKDDRRTPEVDFMFHSQGEPEANHFWFPCHDFPNERCSTEISCTVEDPYQVASNGRLVEITRHANKRSTYHWRQTADHPFYLVAMIVSKFDVVNVGGPDSARPGLWFPVYGPLGAGEAIRDTFANTPEMVAVFERLFDEPFPWDKYGQVICRDFAAGAMENSSCTTFHQAFARGRRGTQDGTIAHELMHQWFGDLVNCRSWEHLWLNEGWASMGEALWAEHQAGRAGYLDSIAGFVAREIAMSRGSAPRATGMVTNRYVDPDQRFSSPNNVYSKGACVLHMLRMRLGDEAFFNGAALYLDRKKFQPAETPEIRQCWEEVSGQSLERFFDQWVYRPGYPRLEIAYAWDDSSKQLSVTLKQVQTIDGDNPAYAFSLPIYCELGSQNGRYIYVDTQEREVTSVFDLPQRPTGLKVNPNFSVLADHDVVKPLEPAQTAQQ